MANSFKCAAQLLLHRGCFFFLSFLLKKKIFKNKVCASAMVKYDLKAQSDVKLPPNRLKKSQLCYAAHKFVLKIIVFRFLSYVEICLFPQVRDGKNRWKISAF